jgi:hypothetical protein
MDKDPPAVWVARSQDAFHDSRLTLHRLGVGMRYPQEVASRAAWHFLYRTPDPPLLDFVRFAKAVGLPVHALLS